MTDVGGKIVFFFKSTSLINNVIVHLYFKKAKGKTYQNSYRKLIEKSPNSKCTRQEKEIDMRLSIVWCSHLRPFPQGESALENTPIHKKPHTVHRKWYTPLLYTGNHKTGSHKTDGWYSICSEIQSSTHVKKEDQKRRALTRFSHGLPTDIVYAVC